MKRFLALLAVLIFVPFSCVNPAFAGDVAQSSGKQTASAAICDDACYLTAVEISTNGTNDITLSLYDNATAASGTVRFYSSVAGENNSGFYVFPHAVMFYLGVYAEVSGTSPEYTIFCIKP